MFFFLCSTRIWVESFKRVCVVKLMHSFLVFPFFVRKVGYHKSTNQFLCDVFNLDLYFLVYVGCTFIECLNELLLDVNDCCLHWEDLTSIRIDKYLPFAAVPSSITLRSIESVFTSFHVMATSSFYRPHPHDQWGLPPIPGQDVGGGGGEGWRGWRGGGYQHPADREDTPIPGQDVGYPRSRSGPRSGWGYPRVPLHPDQVSS